MAENINVNIGQPGSNGTFPNEIADAIKRLGIITANPTQLKIAQVVKVNPETRYVELTVITDKVYNVKVEYPGFMVDPNTGTGIWYGLNKGDIVYCMLDNSNTYKIINKVNNYNTPIQNKQLTDNTSNALFFNNNQEKKKNQNLDLTPGTFLIKADKSKVKLSPEEGVVAGNLGNSSINLDTIKNILSEEADSIYSFSNSGYNIDGVILRDKNKSTSSNTLLDPRVNRVWYNDLAVIGLDPSIPTSSDETKEGKVRNPKLIENRSVVYEYDNYFFVEADDIEKTKYNTKEDYKTKETTRKLNSRRIRKQDVLNLSQVYPNILIEKIEGTVVDSNGNILDLNRTVLPIGKDYDNQLKPSEDSFKTIKQLYRKSIAYHFELNAKKADDNLLKGEGETYADGDTLTYKKNRSRFFFDIDKEGQFKLNVPSSSEIGNVSVLARYENNSTVNPSKDSTENTYNYDYFTKSKDKADILLDGFGIDGTIALKGSDKLIPKDRITNDVINLGTAYHDIAGTCAFLNDTENRQAILNGPDLEIMDLNKTLRTILKNTNGKPVTNVINIDGDNANAGGRSGTAVFDGMLNISIGANTIDRQSLWLDLQGGIVQRIGADTNGISSITQTDGDFYLQIGGETRSEYDEERFQNDNIVVPNANKVHRLEIRVIQPNEHYSRIVIDEAGILLSSDQNIEIRSDQNILMYAGGDISMNAEAGYYHKDEINNDAFPASRQERYQASVYTSDVGGARSVYKNFLGSKQVL